MDFLVGGPQISSTSDFFSVEFLHSINHGNSLKDIRATWMLIIVVNLSHSSFPGHFIGKRTYDRSESA